MIAMLVSAAVSYKSEVRFIYNFNSLNGIHLFLISGPLSAAHLCSFILVCISWAHGV